MYGAQREGACAVRKGCLRQLHCCLARRRPRCVLVRRVRLHVLWPRHGAERAAGLPTLLDPTVIRASPSAGCLTAPRQKRPRCRPSLSPSRAWVMSYSTERRAGGNPLRRRDRARPGDPLNPAAPHTHSGCDSSGGFCSACSPGVPGCAKLPKDGQRCLQPFARLRLCFPQAPLGCPLTGKHHPTLIECAPFLY